MRAARTAPAQPERGPPTLRRPLARAPGTLPTARRRLWFRWTAATMIGETIGFGVPALAGGLAYALAAPETATLPLAVIAGAGEGAILGFAQSSVLRGEIASFDILVDERHRREGNDQAEQPSECVGRNPEPGAGHVAAPLCDADGAQHHDRRGDYSRDPDRRREGVAGDRGDP